MSHQTICDYCKKPIAEPLVVTLIMPDALDIGEDPRDKHFDSWEHLYEWVRQKMDK